MAFPTNAAVIDDFDRASLGDNWISVYGALSISSNTLAGESSGAMGYYSAATFGADIEVYADIVTLPGSSELMYLFGR